MDWARVTRRATPTSVRVEEKIPGRWDMLVPAAVLVGGPASWTRPPPTSLRSMTRVLYGHILSDTGIIIIITTIVLSGMIAHK